MPAAAINGFKIETRRFGKNQRTWLRRLRTTPGAITIDMERTAQEDAVTQITRTLTAPTPGIP